MKRKVVIRVTLNDGKKNARSKAMQIAVGLQGVESVSLQGDDSSQIVVVGDDIDSVNLTSLLRKKVGFAELTSVSPVSTEGEKPKQETNPSESEIQSMIWPTYQFGVPYYYQPSVPYYAYNVTDYNQNSCTIM
ncbi:heavy metal-associated isoprenylated plant protein 46-like [Castanea sativa]|uniref:heavy metal-associated isoprenylated plant protein 46-like n=1 Tax=Castanea sativa TaxID=21020 RepID=UPI003F64CB4D